MQRLDEYLKMGSMKGVHFLVQRYQSALRDITVLEGPEETAGAHVLLLVDTSVPLKPGYGGALSFLDAMRSPALQDNDIKTVWMAITQSLKEAQRIVVRSDMEKSAFAKEFGSWAFGDKQEPTGFFAPLLFGFEPQ